MSCADVVTACTDVASGSEQRSESTATLVQPDTATIQAGNSVAERLEAVKMAERDGVPDAVDAAGQQVERESDGVEVLEAARNCEETWDADSSGSVPVGEMGTEWTDMNVETIGMAPAGSMAGNRIGRIVASSRGVLSDGG